MPENFALYILLILAISAGFILGKRDKRKRENTKDNIPKAYFQGLNYLLNERTDLAIDTFINTMAVSDETLETHLALGNVLRRQGEIDRAIRIHQNLLERPGLSSNKRAFTEIELARDYLSAGLLDRSEKLLKELAERRGRDRFVARKLLLNIYQLERDWVQAIETARLLIKRNLFDPGQLNGKKQDRDRLKTTLAHLLCEQAEITLAAGDFGETNRLLDEANASDPGCARTSLAYAALFLKQRAFDQTKEALRRVMRQNPSLIPETLELYQNACIGKNTEAEYLNYLEECLVVEPHLELVRELAGVRLERSGGEEAVDFVSEQLSRNPSLDGISYLFELLENNDITPTRATLSRIRVLSETLACQQVVFRCNNCGFALSKLIWHCPSCKLWGEINRNMGSSTRSVTAPSRYLSYGNAGQ